MARKRTFEQNLLWAVLMIAVLSTPLAFFANPPLLHAQTAVNDWQKTAGGKMSFDVASVKQNTSHEQWTSNISFDTGDAPPANGGLLSATSLPLSVYIEFAYKLNLAQEIAVDSQLPKWASAEKFDIQARAPMGATRDQMRLMMQSLLADRFQLKTHFETRQTHVYALVLAKPGTTGPKLQRHSDDAPCDPLASALGGPTLLTTEAGFPRMCGSPISLLAYGAATYAGRDVSMDMLADHLITVPNLAVDRPVLNRTGLTGNFDFIMKYSSAHPVSASNSAPDDSGPTFLEALKDQLGLKLETTTAPVDTLIIDHIEEPSPN
jgi:uncharacterized protein (TIGR03435 family)